MEIFKAIIIAIIEGITEFLPVSSTGHMIIAQKLLNIGESDFVKMFIVNIQFGAILSVVVLYWRRFLKSFSFYLKLFVAFLPAAIVGLLFIDVIDRLLESVVVVAISLVVGGVVLVFVDNWFKKPVKNVEVTYPKAFIIGMFQIIAMIPGVSRSAATIIGGLTQKLDRKSAAEFSFFLAVPTMFAASAYKMYKSYEVITTENINILLIGNVVAFIVALIAIKGFISFLTKHGFKIFGYYRIVIGVIILLLLAFGVDLNMLG
jgi:undecaprenyl-diphosphatase